MATKPVDKQIGESACDRRELLRTLGVAGLTLLIGRGCAADGGGPTLSSDDLGLAVGDTGVAAVDTSFVGAAGLPPIDLAAPAVTRMATFALG